MSVTAAVVERGGAPFVLQELERGPLEATEVLVDIHAAGICHTDLTVRGGSFPTEMPVVLGHEGAGVVAEVGADVTRVAVGDRVALSYASCGACPTCASARPFFCHEFFPRNFTAARLDGTTALSRGGEPVHSHFFGQSCFATQSVVPERSVVKLAQDIPFDVVAPFGCGIQTGAGSVLNVLRPGAGSDIAVFGAGGVGLAAVMGAVVEGCERIISVDVKPGRLDLARELGATHTIDAGTQDPVEAILEITGGGIGTTLETSGVTSVLRQAVDSLGPDATCGVVGAPPFGAEVSFDVNMIVAKGQRIRGIVEGGSIVEEFIPRLVDLWREGRLPVDKLVKTYDFDQINEAVEAAESGSVIKPVLRIA